MTAIAIDGPSGAGKSTLARRISGELGYIYVDTGAMYRSIGFYALKNGIDINDEAAVSAALSGISLEISRMDGIQHMLVNGEDVTADIRTEQVSMAASRVSAYPPVRQFLLETQRSMALENNVIMDGRDIGTVVLPNAEVKIFLTATPQDRAKRRYDELTARGEAADYGTVLADVQKRDYNDANRAAAPLKQADDAVLVDTTGLTFDEGYALLKKTITERL